MTLASTRDGGADERPMKAVWGIAVCLAVAVHAGGFLYALIDMKPNDQDVALGAPAIEIGLDLASPKADDENLPPGPQSEAAAASSASANQDAKAQPNDLPKAQPTETDDPDRVVAPDASKPEKQDDPNVKELKSNPTAESVASEATAPPKIDAARESTRSVAPAQGIGDSALRVKATWQRELAAHLNRFKHYPPGASPRGATIVVSFTLDRVGHVIADSVEKSSGDKAFDDAALSMLKRADPVPRPPPAVADDGLTFSIPVIFRGRKR